MSVEDNLLQDNGKQSGFGWFVCLFLLLLLFKTMETVLIHKYVSFPPLQWATGGS